ncbi:MAG: hypothetical protein WBD47_16285, partial [Phormidesmis sp.]
MRVNIRLNLTSEQMRLHLLAGFDSWLSLGLLSDEQVRELAAQLSEPLPVAQTSEVAAIESTDESTIPSAVESASESATREASWLSQAMRSLLDEISVIWLLFLGVFLVVVSSGVLAASQWQSFSAVGQYAILFAYTLAFWGASLWAKRQEQLQTTARMLVLTTLLLIPVNFWMMDALGVLNSALGKGAGGLAAVVLSALPFT